MDKAMTSQDRPEMPGLETASPDLRHAGAVVDQAIDYMTKQSIDPVAIASALSSLPSRRPKGMPDRASGARACLTAALDPGRQA
jgi:hypothetical protein